MPRSRSQPRGLLVRLYLDQELAGVLSLEEKGDGLLGLLQAAADDGLLALEAAVGDPAADLLAGGRVLGGVVEDDEALHADALRDDVVEVLDAGGLAALAPAQVVVAADRAAHGEARVLRGALQHRVEDLAPHVVEVHVHVVRGGLAELLAEVGRLVVDGGVEAELLRQHAALVGAAGDADDAGAAELGDLAGDGARGAAGTRHHDGLSRLRVPDPQHAEVRRQARDAERAERVDRPCPRRQRHHLERLRAHHRYLGPPARGVDQIALLHLRVARRQHAGHSRAAHALADRDGRDIGSDVYWERGANVRLANPGR